MAKQKGLFQIDGKMGDMSFYHGRKEGWQVRSINPTISERVKKSPAYLNTRLHNGEFGAATDTAAKTLQPLNQRWRYLLRPKVQGLLTAKAFELMSLDNANPFGQRRIPYTNLEEFQNYYNALNKNQVPQFLSSWMRKNVIYTASENKVRFEQGIGIEVKQQEYWHALGADSMKVELYCFRVSVPYWEPNRNCYVPAESELSASPIASGEAIFDYVQPQGLFPVEQINVPFVPVSSGSIIAGVLMVVKPCKRINNVSYVLQGLCSSYWYSILD